ncbi:uncharacterized protein LOC106098512 isoform X2 [Oreochromis niloticus]|uniref:uncharacterized protein LOC106098512 isoform X2 n=1 Tax=Oreochromis niloticus TaxID=8128 RepID=UPI0006744C73|nr:uncharacterized protein LOC106098512 isoform X2 [Oreochromis niloticus]
MMASLLPLETEENDACKLCSQMFSHLWRGKTTEADRYGLMVGLQQRAEQMKVCRLAFGRGGRPHALSSSERGAAEGQTIAVVASGSAVPALFLPPPSSLPFFFSLPVFSAS